MTPSRAATCLLLCALSLSCQPTAHREQTPEERRAVADTVERLFGEIAEATNALDFDRLLGYYQESDDLTYVARGQITRTHAAFADIMDAQFGGLTQANLQWLDMHVDVLDPDVAVATATFEFVATLGSGATVQSAGTYTAIYVRHDGRWKIQYSAHSFPLTGG